MAEGRRDSADARIDRRRTRSGWRDPGLPARSTGKAAGFRAQARSWPSPIRPGPTGVEGWRLRCGNREKPRQGARCPASEGEGLWGFFGVLGLNCRPAGPVESTHLRHWLDPQPPRQRDGGDPPSPGPSRAMTERKSNPLRGKDKIALKVGALQSVWVTTCARYGRSTSSAMLVGCLPSDEAVFEGFSVWLSRNPDGGDRLGRLSPAARGQSSKKPDACTRQREANPDRGRQSAEFVD